MTGIWTFLKVANQHVTHLRGNAFAIVLLTTSSHPHSFHNNILLLIAVSAEMKPRPIFPSFIAPVRSTCMFAQAQLQYRSSVYFQTARLRTNSQWNDKRWSVSTQTTRYASTSTASASKPSYGRQPPPLSKAKPAKPSVPAKPSKSSPPAKVHTASASSAVSAKRAATPSAAPSTPSTPAKPNDKLNPPSFTYPPDLSVPARKEGQNYASYLFSCGKAYISFYKSGISHTRQTLKLAKSLRAKLASQGRGVSEPIAGAGILSRAEWQVLRRSKRDLLRLPVMGFLILALGEWLPLIVVYLTPVIPEACRIPTQVERTLRKVEEKRKERLNRIALHALRLQSRDRTPRTDEDAIRLAAAAEGLLSPDGKVGKQGGMAMASAIVPPSASADLGLFHLLLLSARLDCHPRILDTLYLTPPKWLLQRNVGKKLAYLTQDDELIRRDGGVQALDKQELLRACKERGIDVLGKSEAEQRKGLALWYKM